MYKWMSVEQILKYLPEIEKENVSEIARSERGFLYNYLKIGSADKMKNVVNSRGNTWDKERNLFITRTLAAYNKKPTRRRFLSLIAWAFFPK